MRKRRAMILFELLISIIILSVVVLYSIKFSFNIYKQNSKNLNLNIGKMDLESTKLFLQENDFDYLSYSGTNLIYNNRLLLNNVTKFEYLKNNNLIFIDICIKRKYEICKEWVLN
jgi:hypothetical protein